MKYNFACFYSRININNLNLFEVEKWLLVILKKNAYLIL